MALLSSISPVILAGLVAFVVSADIQRVYFLDGSCSRQTEPLHALVLQFIDQQDLLDDEYHLPSSDVDCYITFNRVEFPGKLNSRISVKGRSSNYSVVNPHNCVSSSSGPPAAGCLQSNAFIQVYYGGGTDTGRVLKLAGTFCGLTPIPYMEVPEQYQSVTIRLVIQRLGAGLTTGPPAPLQSNSSTNSSVVAPSPDPTKASCGVHFSIDITAFFTGKCHQDGWRNNKYQFYCKKQDKCISEELVCDGFLSNNCGDYSDNSVSAPANCGQRKSTLESLLWLWTVLGLLLAALLLYWCCWRPGWFPWWIACLRNVCYDTKHHNCSRSCSVFCCGRCYRAAAEKTRRIGVKPPHKTGRNNSPYHQPKGCRRQICCRPCCLSCLRSSCQDAKNNKVSSSSIVVNWGGMKGASAGLHVRSLRF